MSKDSSFKYHLKQNKRDRKAQSLNSPGMAAAHETNEKDLFEGAFEQLDRFDQ